MASLFERVEQAAHGYQPTVQVREIPKDELQGYLCTLTNPRVSIAITCSCWKGDVLRQTGVKYPVAEEEAERTTVRASVNEGLCRKKRKAVSS